jgi:cell division transport system permease protein
MSFLILKRILKESWQIIFRVGEIALANIFIFFLVFSLFNFLFIFSNFSKYLISKIEEKADVSVYFKQEVPEEEIFKVKENLSKMPEVKSISYYSREDALEDFLKRHKDDENVQKALEEVGNPFFNSLRIKTQDLKDYEKVLAFFEKEEVKNLIEHIDYLERKPVVEKISFISKTTTKVGIFVSLFLILISVLVIFTIVKLGVLKFSEEISIQRLVGAPNYFIFSPFFISILICISFGIFLSVCFFAILFSIFSGKLLNFLAGFHLFNFFKSNLLKILALDFASGILLGFFTSFLATRKYLKI